MTSNKHHNLYKKCSKYLMRLCPQHQTCKWKCKVLNLSSHRSIHSLVCHQTQPVWSSVNPLTRLSPNLWKWYFKHEWTDFDANWHNWSMGQRHELINCGSQQEVKGQRQMSPNIDLKASHVSHITDRTTEVTKDAKLCLACVSDI